jgi:two-component system chemotaxis sensor kinase CheA
MDQARTVFVEEARDLLSELETALLELEENTGDHDLVDRVFRAMHTIKGSGAMFGFEEIASFTHDVETVFDRVRSGEIPVTKPLLDLTLQARDHLLTLLDGDGTSADQAKARAILAGMGKFLGRKEGAAADAAMEPKPAGDAAPGAPDGADDADAGGQTIYHIRFKPSRTIFLTGTNPLLLIEELMGLGRASVTAHLQDVPPIEECDPESCYAWWDIILESSAGRDSIKDVFIFVEDDCEVDIRVVDASSLDIDPAYKKLGEILVERGDASPKEIDRVLEAQKPLGELLVDAGVVSRTRLDAALAEQTLVRETRSARQKGDGEAAASIRVAADKLDFLVDLVGELVIVQSRLSQLSAETSDPTLSSIAEELERLSNELRDSTLGIRMLPIGTTFTKFKRMVRDLSAELRKEIELVTRGGETELDKTVIEKLGDPLVHLLRNSIDHGIETPEDRAAMGKPRHGTVVLSAEHAGGEVVIRITDDGRGLDLKAIRAKGLEKGLISPDAALTDKETMLLIFAPGFSTAASVTSVSGRGVGMDVVKRSIDSLRGSIDIGSTAGAGTEIVIRLPLTLAIIDGLQVKVGEEFFVMPLAAVEECVELDACGGHGKIVDLRGEAVPYIRLREHFEVRGEPPRIEQVVVVAVGDDRVGVVVDQVIGKLQTVIKSLGRFFKDVDGVSGATVRGNGDMAVILDVPGIYRSALADRNGRIG